MAHTSLSLFKKQVHADDYTVDDEYLQLLLDAAEEAVFKATNRTYSECVCVGEGEFPKPLTIAILMLAAHWYNQRESVSNTQMCSVPYGFDAQVKPYTKLICSQDE